MMQGKDLCRLRNASISSNEMAMSVFMLKARQWASMIRLTPFDTNTEEGRSNERLRRVTLTALTSAFAQGISIIAMLVSTPLVFKYLGSERYGLWLAISSLVVVIGFADLGMGNGLLNFMYPILFTCSWASRLFLGSFGLVFIRIFPWGGCSI
jgi:hypothetical protein